MAINHMIESKLKEKIDGLSSVQREAVYDYLHSQYVRQDIENLLSDEYEDVSVDDDFIDVCTYRYVYDGDYECNLDYWTNLKNIIDNELERLNEKETNNG